MMRRDTVTFPDNGTVAEFRRRFPLGSTSRVILADDTGRYAGIVLTPAAFADDVKPDEPVARKGFPQHEKGLRQP